MCNVKIFNMIIAKARAILARDVMEADCMNFSELTDKMSRGIIELAKEGLYNEKR